MNSQTNRQCFNSYFVPIDYLPRFSWPPTYVTCDCGELAKHIVHFELLPCGAPHFVETGIWQCAHCGKNYKVIKGTRNFECFSCQTNEKKGVEIHDLYRK